MIHEHDTCALTVLADGRTCWWACRDSTIKAKPKLTNWEPLSTIKMWDMVPPFYALGQGGRILRGVAPYASLVDITDTVCEIMGHSNLDACEISVGLNTVCVRVDDALAILKSDGNGPVVYRFSITINLFGFNGHRGFVRTRDNRLYSVGTLVRYETNHNGYTSTINIGIDSEPREMLFAEAVGIREIVCRARHTLLLMYDGRVFALINRSLYSNKKETFEQVMFPDGKLIAKIVSNEKDIYYITTEGLCYHAGSTKTEYIMESWALTPQSHHHEAYGNVSGLRYDGIRYDQGLEPVLIGALTELVVENIFILRDTVIVQYDGDRLCMLHLKTLAYSQAMLIDEAHINGTRRPTSLPFFDGKGIVSVTQVCDTAFFVTEGGRVYQASININTAARVGDSIMYFHMGAQARSLMNITTDPDCIVPITEPIKFFDTNPCMTERYTSMIGSASSIIGGDM